MKMMYGLGSIIISLLLLNGCETKAQHYSENERQSVFSNDMHIYASAVKRVFKSDYAEGTYVAVLLKDKATFGKTYNPAQALVPPDEFFFINVGDTIYYRGRKIIRIARQ